MKDKTRKLIGWTLIIIGATISSFGICLLILNNL